MELTIFQVEKKIFKIEVVHEKTLRGRGSSITLIL